MLLPDVNVWIGLAFDSHLHHPAANAWYEASSEACYFCRWTQQGFLRLATNPAVFGAEAVSLKEAWHLYDAILSDPRVAFAEEAPGVERYWRAYTQRQSFSPKVWSDAYLAAFAKAAAFEIITFDTGLRQYKGAHCTVLS
jgi:toxin-antitoxin system PIN domain toxin